jgi:CRISPR/Cas system CMR-associated protein Cmr3 (group 5 of RAMP superfamily)
VENFLAEELVRLSRNRLASLWIRNKYKRVGFITVALLKENIFDKRKKTMACAGDVVIMGRRLQDFEEVCTSLVKKKDGVGNKFKKTKFSLVSRMSYSENEHLTLGTYNLEIVKGYACIGTILTHKN